MDLDEMVTSVRRHSSYPLDEVRLRQLHSIELGRRLVAHYGEMHGTDENTPDDFMAGTVKDWIATTLPRFDEEEVALLQSIKQFARSLAEEPESWPTRHDLLITAESFAWAVYRREQATVAHEATRGE